MRKGWRGIAPMKKKRQLVLLVLAIAAVVAVTLGIVMLVRFAGSDAPQPAELPESYFRTPDWDADILADPVYLALPRQIHFLRDGEGVYYPLDEENYASYGAAPALLYRYLMSLIRGDCATYRTLFSDAYLSKEGTISDFTMQRLYGDEETGIVIRYIGVRGDRPMYSITYCIASGDGTFRRDLRNDTFSTVYFFLTPDADDPRIDLTLTESYRVG